MGAPGRLSRYDQPDGPPVVIAADLRTPTSLARDPASGDLFVTEIFTGRIIRVKVPLRPRVCVSQSER